MRPRSELDRLAVARPCVLYLTRIVIARHQRVVAVCTLAAASGAESQHVTFVACAMPGAVEARLLLRVCSALSFADCARVLVVVATDHSCGPQYFGPPLKRAAAAPVVTEGMLQGGLTEPWSAA